MQQMQQKEICINEVVVPIIEDEGGEKYYPISYMGSKVLLKDLSPSQLKQNGYGKYIEQFEIDYGEKIGGLQLAYCISEEGLKAILSNCKIARLTIEQKIAMKGVCEYINLYLEIDTEEKFLDSYPKDKWSKYDFWLVECIQSVLDQEPNIKWQRCSKCGKYYPYNRCFFGIESNPHNKHDLKTVCNKCYKGTRVLYYNDSLLTNTYYEDGVEWYKFIKNNKNIYDIYDYYIKNNMKYPKILKNNLLVGNIISKHYKDIVLNNLDIMDETFVGNISNIPIQYISMKMISKNIIESTKRKDLLEKSKIEKEISHVKLKSVTKAIKNLSYDESIQILNEYLLNKNIIIQDIYNYDYYKLLQKTKVKYYLQQNNIDSLEFIVNYYNWEYAPYKFKTIGTKFWQKKDNVDKTLKYLIEKDMKLQIEKIPLYITKYNLQKKCRVLYDILYNKRFDDTLFDWINRLYPEKFIIEDFSIGIIRNQFDSMDEQLIDKMLRENFKSVTYNNRQSDNRVTIMGMNPDWFVFTDLNLYIVEYFGIALHNSKYNKRISEYIDKTEEKINKYSILPYGKKIFLFPEDIKGDCKEFYEKIKDIR